MSELASMAAYKSTNNTSNNIITTTTTVSTPTQQAQQQPNSPVLSTASSLVSPDSSATNPISSPDVQTPQNTPQTNSPLTTMMAGTGNSAESVANDDLSYTKEPTSSSTTPTNQNAPVNNNNNNKNISNNNNIVATKTSSSSSLDNNISIVETISTTVSIVATTSAATDMTKCDSPLIDTKSSGSVLDKASMFEKKLEEQQSQIINTQQSSTAHHPISLLNSTLNLTPATVARLESIYGKKTEEIYNKASGLLDRADTGQLLFSSNVKIFRYISYAFFSTFFIIHLYLYGQFILNARNSACQYVLLIA